MKMFRKELPKGDMLLILKRNRGFRWLFFISACIGALVTIIKVPLIISDFLIQQLNTDQTEYEKVSELKLDTTLEYVTDIFGAPTYEVPCDSDLHIPCLLSEYSVMKYTFDEGDYYVQVLTDKDGLVISYSIFARTLTFNPQLELFLGRFEGYKTLTLGKSTFSDFNVIEGNNGFIRSVDEPILGNNFGGFLQAIYSDDYAVDHIFLFEASSWASYSRLSSDFSCDYPLLDTYGLDEVSIEENKQNFKETCPIQSLTVITTYMPEVWAMSSNDFDQFSKDQLKFFSID